MYALEIKNLSVAIENKKVISDLSLNINSGEIHAILGQNGAGKSSLAKAIIGHPDCKITNGKIVFYGAEINNIAPEKIAQLGIFMAFQNPPEIEGVSVANFIRAAMQDNIQAGEKFIATEFYKKLYNNMNKLSIDKSFTSRSLNVGFSGGEKKRCEMLQMLMLQPRFAIIDEIDSGLDIDAIKVVIQCINSMRNDQFSALIITHNNNILEHLNPNMIHIMSDGKIIDSGNKSVIERLEKSGFQDFKSNQE